MVALEARLKARAQDSAATVAARMAKSAEEMSYWSEYDYVVVNRDLAESVAEVPAILTAALSPALGQLAEARGRRLVLFLGFCTLPIRAALFAYITDPALIVLVQALDGIAGASIGIIGPLVTAAGFVRTRRKCTRPPSGAAGRRSPSCRRCA
jgi:MFS family permease